MGDLQVHLIHCAECSAVFDQKQHDLCAPPSYSPDLAPGSFFVLLVSRDEKSPQRETYCQCGIGETKNGRSTKRHISDFKNCFEQWKNVSMAILHQMESTLKVTKI